MFRQGCLLIGCPSYGMGLLSQHLLVRNCNFLVKEPLRVPHLENDWDDGSMLPQAAVGVVQKGLRPVIPPTCPSELADLMRTCWARNPDDRPSFDALKVHFTPFLTLLLTRLTRSGKHAAPHPPSFPLAWCSAESHRRVVDRHSLLCSAVALGCQLLDLC